MSITDAYLVTTKNLEGVFNAILSARAPEKFTNSFLVQLDFKSSNDRLYIRLLKALKFLDDNSCPTERYYKFLDQSVSKKILAKAIEEAYDELFLINKKAYEMSIEEVKNKLKTITQGKYKDNILRLMANTFVELCNYAEWNHDNEDSTLSSEEEAESKNMEECEKEKQPISLDYKSNNLNKPSLHYNIQIHLPESRDTAVYDAIFQSLKKHLL